MKGPLIGADLAQAIQGKIDALADADSGKANQEQEVGFEIIQLTELRLEVLIVL